mmetsp:Transcript_34052/g.74740  ORF Transcript_34052/g.74740 Transcript_34052/m.74740 type:complete len:268 (+) Transcript_34052:133-936(+)
MRKRSCSTSMPRSVPLTWFDSSSILRWIRANSPPRTEATFISSWAVAGSRSIREVMSASTDVGNSILVRSGTLTVQTRFSTWMTPSSRIERANSIAQSGLPSLLALMILDTAAGTFSASSVDSSSFSMSLSSSPASCRSALACACTILRYSGGRSASGCQRSVSTSMSGRTSRMTAPSSFHEAESIQCTSSKMRTVRAEPSFIWSTLTMILMVSLSRVSPVRCLVTSLSPMDIGSTGLSSGANWSSVGSASSCSSTAGRTHTSSASM